MGVKSTALRFQEHTKPWLGAFTVAMLSGLILAGANANQTVPYYVSVSAVAFHLAQQVSIVQDSTIYFSLFVCHIKDAVILESSV